MILLEIDKVMVEFIESKLVRLRKEVDEMWELVRTQIDKSGNAVQNLNREDAPDYLYKHNLPTLILDSHLSANKLVLYLVEAMRLYQPKAFVARFSAARFYSSLIFFHKHQE